MVWEKGERLEFTPFSFPEPYWVKGDFTNDTFTGASLTVAIAVNANFTKSALLSPSIKDHFYLKT
ncbi:hypothetical protein [Nostoc sp. NZL]|uniref:hypothetical protein n=1 Tax=Nostoc sp. NZL TaxID=2650612 RepID=UPI0018C48A5F|nr:hypothetical protein [Nostoc sp. NZL]MBG1241970.1 hypothetical protein [Nostoc sp. NZL]